MQNDLYALLDLSQIDQKIHALLKNKREFPDAIERLEAAILEEKRGALDLSEEIQALESQNKALESQVSDFKEGLKKSEDKLQFIKTNAEYDAVHTEIATHKTKIIQSDDLMLKNLGTLEQINARSKAALERIDNVAIAKMEEELKALREKLTSLESECAEEQKRREEEASKVDPKIVRVYERLQGRSQNGRCVGLVTDDRRTCGGCYIHLTAQKFIEVRRNNILKQCEACGAILVWKKE